MRRKETRFEESSALLKVSKELAFDVSECISEKNLTFPDKFIQFRETSISIFNDISIGIKQKQKGSVLFLFSKARSSCLIMEEILQKIWFSLPEGSSLSFLLKLIEIKSILKKQIEILQIDQLVLKNKKTIV